MYRRDAVATETSALARENLGPLSLRIGQLAALSLATVRPEQAIIIHGSLSVHKPRQLSMEDRTGPSKLTDVRATDRGPAKLHLTVII